jgi:hypothetical protein
MKYGYAYVLDTMADWEHGFVIAELNSGLSPCQNGWGLETSDQCR